MAATTLTLTPANLSDASFRAWGKPISDQLLAGGWVQTADTGQINWATATRTGANNEYGYEIWRSNDAGGGLDEIYIRVSYGYGTFTALTPNLRITVGWGSNGAGSLTGYTTIANTLNSAVSETNAGMPCYLAVGAGWLALMMFHTDGNGQFFSLERTRNANGTQRNEVLVAHVTGVGYMKSQVCHKTEGVFTQIVPTAGLPHCQALVDYSSAVQGANVGYSMQFGQRGYLTNPAINIFGTGATTMGAYQSIVSITSYGVAHTYILLGTANGYPYFFYTATASTNQSIIMRYE